MNAPSQIREIRKAAGLTQEQAAAMVYMSRRGWQDGERGERVLSMAAWTLFLIKLHDPDIERRALNAIATKRRAKSSVRAKVSRS